MPKIVDHHACVTGYPHYDPEGVVCANDGDPDEEAYCSYDLGPSVCAYCTDNFSDTDGQLIVAQS